RAISKLDDEEYVRAYVVVRLIKELEYPPNCIELEYEYGIGHPGPKGARGDIRVLARRKNSKKPTTFMLIENKRPDEFDTYMESMDGQLFATGRDEHSRGVRYVVWYSIEFSSDTPNDRSIVIDFKRHTEW